MKRVLPMLILAATGFLAGWWLRGSGESPPPKASPASPSTVNREPVPGRGAVDLALGQVDALMRSGGNELAIPFPKLIESSTGKLLIPFDPANPVHQTALDAVAEALGAVLAEMNREGSPAKGLRRINEASSHFEDRLRELLDAHPDFECGFPLSTTGKIQRSGYPDLRLFHPASGTVIYLDPKLFEASSRDSTLRTFYFTSDPDTLKVREDGLHWLLGIAHDGRDGEWTFLSWDIVELSRLEVKLKAEFQAGNHTLYAREMILRDGKAK